MKIITNSYFMLTLFVLLSVQTLFAESKDTTTVKLSTSNSLSNIANNASLNTENDSQRVANIFYWVAHHIAWDTKSINKEEKLKFRKSKEILKTKTANSHEYAQLMKDLCEMVGVKAMVITGYEKNELYEDGAGFYGPNHAWNAVLIGNKWLLLDVHNAAGSAYMDLSWWKKKMQKWHKKKLYTSTKLKFQYEYNPKYLFQDPEEVRLDRVPVDPIWQLTDTVMPIALFEKNEADIIFFNEHYSQPKQYAITLSEIYNLSENDYILECADRTYAYNPRYTEMKANKHIALGNEKIKAVNKSVNEKEAIDIVKSTKEELDTAKNLLTTQKKDISEKYTLLRKVNSEKRTDVTKYKQSFTSVNEKHLTSINAKRNSAASKKETLQTDSKSKAKRMNDISEINYAKAKTMTPEKPEEDAEMLKLKDSIMSRNSKITMLNEEINMYKNQVATDKEYKNQCIDSLNIYIKLAETAFYKEAVARSKKQDSFDDSIKVLRSSLYYYKGVRLDSLQHLYFNLYDTLLASYDIIKKDYAFIIDAAKKNSTDLTLLKKMNSKNNMESAFQTNASNYRDAIRGYVNNNLSQINFLAGELTLLDQMKKVYNKQNDYFDFLINNEDDRKAYVKKMLDKFEGIEKKHNEQKKDIINDYKDELDDAYTKVKKKKKKA